MRGATRKLAVDTQLGLWWFAAYRAVGVVNRPTRITDTTCMASAVAMIDAVSRTVDAVRRRVRRWWFGGHERTALSRAHWQAGRYVAASAAARAARAAIEAGDLDDAQDTIQFGLIDDPQHATLHELSAWCQLIEGRADLAVESLSRDARNVARRRLLLNVARCQSAQKQAAHLDLLAWNREERCPTEARLLLAILEAEAGNREAARAILTESLQHDADTLTCQMLVLLELEDETKAIPNSRSVNLLAHAFSHDAAVDRWITSLELPAPAALPDVPLEMIDQLAAQLLQRPDVIPTLVVAQRHAEQPHRVELLRRALGRIVWDLEHPLPAVEALGELSLLAGQYDDARRWVRHGLRDQPFSASLALMLDRIDRTAPDSATDTAATLHNLRVASHANSQYADLRRALILRYDSEGLRHLAQRHAQAWLANQPDHPLARKTLAELAA